MKVTFFGTTTLLFDDGKDQILFDAHMTRPSLMKYIFGSAPTDRAVVDRELQLNHVDRLKAIFVSHSHHDHVMDAPYIVQQTKAVIYGSSSALNVARGGGIPEEKLVQFRANDTYEVGGYRIKVIPVHWDNFFSPLTKPTVGMPRLVEKTEVVFFKLANYCEAHGVNCVVQIPGTSMEI